VILLPSQVCASQTGAHREGFLFLGSICSPTIPQIRLLSNHSHSLPVSLISPLFSASPPPTCALIGVFPTHVWTGPLAFQGLDSPNSWLSREPSIVRFGPVVVEIWRFLCFGEVERYKAYPGRSRAPLLSLFWPFITPQWPFPSLH
jgi:hypothetical protein